MNFFTVWIIKIQNTSFHPSYSIPLTMFTASSEIVTSDIYYHVKNSYDCTVWIPLSKWTLSINNPDQVFLFMLNQWILLNDYLYVCVCMVHTLCFKKDIWNFYYNVPAINSPGKDKEPLASHSCLCEWNHHLHWAGFSPALQHQSTVSLSLVSLEESTLRLC